MSVSNIVYIMRKELDNERIKDILVTLTSLFTVVDLRETDLTKAVDLQFLIMRTLCNKSVLQEQKQTIL